MLSKKFPFLFLDRDGVINRRLPGQYVQSIEEFKFLPGVLDAFPRLSKKTDKIIIVTNQQGVGKELMTYEQLDEVHQYMQQQIEKKGGRVDAIFSCTELASDTNNCRKPSPAMGIYAKKKFPQINFSRALMVGDSASDIQFGQALGMKTVLMQGKEEEDELRSSIRPDYTFHKFSKILDLF
jgi:histidinol-phosphate phosphatase family protein